ncbi:hypothetical protein F5Y16DRAFT_78963 [Xylariaceae sp. FL0255]|nr:hypothetical protein F5Y16DRAFT_78963 [Xylariaceae sp. FL0255]
MVPKGLSRFLMAGSLLPFASAETITRDVAIIGGGSAGTYAAIALKDAGHTVAVIEKTQRLGGHANTYNDPVSGAAIDYGVIALGDVPIVQTYLQRLNITPVVGTVDPGNISFFDFKTGEHNPYYVEADPTDAIENYVAQLANYPYLNITYDLPSTIPEDLLMTWGDFSTKYSLSDMSRVVWQWAQGYGELLNLPAMYIVKFLSPRWVNGVAGTGFVFTSTENFSMIYGAATEVLGDDVLFGSTVLSVDRDKVDADGYMSLSVNENGVSTTIRAKRIISAIPPLASEKFLSPLGLDAKESSIFSKFKHFNYWTSAVREPAIPAFLNIQNVSPGNMTTPYFYPDLPAAYFLRITQVAGMYIMTYGTPAGVNNLTDSEVEAELSTTLQKLRDSGYYGTNVTEPFEIVAFENHSPYELNVDVKDIQNGFYGDLYGLQGYRNTWYSGAAWVCHDSSAIWEYTAGIAQAVSESLN